MTSDVAVDVVHLPVADIAIQADTPTASRDELSEEGARATSLWKEYFVWNDVSNATGDQRTGQYTSLNFIS